jgi:hypothetical protein
MSGELEAAGAAATAGLVGAAIEGRSGVRHGEGKCLNCGADVNGRYCANCGQPTHVHRTLAHVFEEFLHGLLHFDTKAWRTLPLLIARPGTLTRDYIFGRRARYISPLATFLFTVFVMFFVFAVVSDDADIRLGQPNYQRMSDADLQEALKGAVEGEKEMRDRAARMRAEGLEGGAKGMERGAEGVARARRGVEREMARRAGRPLPPEIEEDEQSLITVDGAVGLNALFREKLKNPELLFYKVRDNAYQYSFLLVPISLPFVALLFLWKRGWTFYDHVVFTLYSLSFMSLLFIAAALMSMGGDALEGWMALLVSLGVPTHMFFQLKGTYGLGWWSALWRTFFLLVFALICLIVYILLMFVFGVLS